MIIPFIINMTYIAASILFIYGLKMLSNPDTARRGNRVSAVGMLIAVIATLMQAGIGLPLVFTGLVIGTAIGVVTARVVKMTAMPEMVALFNGSGGIASLLVGWSEYNRGIVVNPAIALAVFLAVLIGGVTFSGSLVAFAKLAGRLPGRPILFKNQHIYNAGLLVLAVLLGVIFMSTSGSRHLLVYLIFLVVLAAALALGVLAVIPIGGADMPIVISLLNSYSGLAASAAGFIIENNVLIVAGSLVGASGLILTNIMCKAMNRSLTNVLFGGFGGVAQEAGEAVTGEVKAISPMDAYYILEAANRVIFVPGYGMAVAQAQHTVRELATLLEDNGADVSYAIHPVAGRMPGHMNVLLAEANVPYEQLVGPDDVNPQMDTVDVAIVIGANDVVNPAAREDKSSPLYGMPVINVDDARTVFVLKRSMNPGFSGVQNPLFFKDNTRMLFGDAKSMVGALATEFKDDD
ncbi:MAG: NAD(P)(+) transhydrogenase (Re/Si-specific) subunit beta [Deinococcota bacterium]